MVNYGAFDGEGAGRVWFRKHRSVAYRRFTGPITASILSYVRVCVSDSLTTSHTFLRFKDRISH